MLRSVRRASTPLLIGRLAQPAAGALYASGNLQRRTFIGGAFASDFEEARAKARRRRIRSFLLALDELPSSVHQESSQVLCSALTEQASPDGNFYSRDQLQLAVDSARLRLKDLHGQAPLRLAEAPAPATDAQAPGAQVAQPDDDDDDESLLAQPLDDAERSSLAAVRTSLAIQELPELWAQLLSAQDASAEDPLPLPMVIHAALSLCDPQPMRRISFHVDLAHGIVQQPLRSVAMASGEAETSSTTGAPLASDDINRTYAVEKVRAAATATVEARRPALRPSPHPLSP